MKNPWEDYPVSDLMIFGIAVTCQLLMPQMKLPAGAATRSKRHGCLAANSSG